MDIHQCCQGNFEHWLHLKAIREKMMKEMEEAIQGVVDSRKKPSLKEYLKSKESIFDIFWNAYFDEDDDDQYLEIQEAFFSEKPERDDWSDFSEKVRNWLEIISD
jgi:hypothetical protein